MAETLAAQLMWTLFEPVHTVSCFTPDAPRVRQAPRRCRAAAKPGWPSRRSGCADLAS